MERLKRLLEHVHHSYAVSETYDQVEARRMESHTVSLVVKHLADVKRRRIGVVPDSDGLIDGAGDDEVLLDADIHALNVTGVEGVH